MAAIAPISYKPFLQASIAPVKLVVSLFLKTIGFLLDFLGAQDWAKSLNLRAKKMDSNVVATFEGLWSFGLRFQSVSENAIENCRGSSYWFVNQYFLGKNVFEIADSFADGPPMQAVGMQKDPNPPGSIRERCIFIVESEKYWPPLPLLDPGIYTIVLGYSENERGPIKGHRVVLLNSSSPMLFDPSTGLTFWKTSDWEPFLDRKASAIRTSNAGYFTIAIYSYEKN